MSEKTPYISDPELETAIVNNENFLCYIADKDTYDILFANQTIRNILGLRYEGEYLGKKCYKVFQNLDQPCAHCANECLKPGQNIHRKMFVHLTQTNYLLIDSLIHIQGKNQRLTIAYNYDIEHAESEEISQKLTMESTLLKCAHTLMEEHTLEEAINHLLSIVCDYHNADRAYLCEIKEDYKIQKTFESSSINNTIQMCSEEPLTPETLQATLDFLKKGKELVIANINETFDETSYFFNFFKKNHVDSALLIPLLHKGCVTSFMGVDNPRIMPEDLTLLGSVALFINDDIKKRRFQKKLETLSYIDALTGLYNRNKYAELIEKNNMSNVSSLGVIHVNINGLKQTNELYGEEYGDYLIKEVANILSTDIKDNIYRLSGDEFVALCFNIAKPDFDKRIIALRKKNIERKDIAFAVGGIWQGKKIDIRQGVRQAGEIMVAEKQKYYKEKPTKEIQSRSNSLKILLEELRQGFFFIYLQPKVELQSGRVIGAEALVRKRDKENKIVPPDVFIPIYEHEGTIRHVDFFVFEQVCLLLKELIKEKKALKIAVNFSRVTFMAYDLVGEMMRICKHHDIPHKYIEVEITESIDKLDFEFFERKLRAIETAGFAVSLDDFGAKHSNLLMLAMIDFTEVKIDKSLIDHMTTRNKNKTVVKNIIKTIKELGASLCLAEGIETEEQKHALLELGCQHGQGYHFYKPLPQEAFMDLCRSIKTKR